MTVPDLSPTTIAWLGNALLQSSVLLAAALVANRLLRRASAAARHAVLLSAALGIPLLLALSAVVPSWRVPLPEVLITADNTVATSTLEFGPARSASPPVAPTPTATAALPAEHTISIPALLILAWSIGIGLLWLRLVIGIVALAFQRGVGTSATMKELVAEEAAKMGLPKAPALLLRDSGSMPVTWQLRGHTLALPESAEAWSRAKLRSVVRHELAHIQRHDCINNWLAELCLATLWFHPFAWLLKRQLHATREGACDDVVLAPDDAESCDSYARTLLEIVTTHSRSQRCPGPRPSNGTSRPRYAPPSDAILDPNRDRRPLSIRGRVLGTAAWATALVALASLSACSSVDTADSAAPPVETAEVSNATSHIAVEIRKVELETAAPLESYSPTQRRLAMSEPAMSFSGVVPNERLREILSELGRKGGKSTTMPTIVSRFGQKAKAEKLREIIYPTHLRSASDSRSLSKGHRRRRRSPRDLPHHPLQPESL